MAKKNTNTIGLPVLSATTIDRYRFVTLNVANNLGTAAEAGDNSDAVAVSVEASAAGDTIVPCDPIDNASIVEVEASAAIAAGDRVGSAANGKAKTAVANNPSLGYALEAASADGEVIKVFASKQAGDA